MKAEACRCGRDTNITSDRNLTLQVGQRSPKNHRPEYLQESLHSLHFVKIHARHDARPWGYKAQMDALVAYASRLDGSYSEVATKDSILTF